MKQSTQKPGPTIFFYMKNPAELWNNENVTVHVIALCDTPETHENRNINNYYYPTGLRECGFFTKLLVTKA